MSFGTVSSTPTGGGSTLTGFILSKASQSRKEARKKDRSEKRKNKQKSSSGNTESKKQKSNPSNKLFGSFPKIGDLFSFKKPQVKSDEARTRTSGGATGLAQILTQGFGSLSADTMGISSGLASVTQVMNNSLKAQSFTATGIQTIATILSDQLENQGSILSTVKSLRPGGGGGGGRGLFGTSKSKGASSDTLTESLIKSTIGRMIGDKIKQLTKGLFGRAREAIAPRPKASTPIKGSSAWAKNFPKQAAADAARRAAMSGAKPSGIAGGLKNILPKNIGISSFKSMLNPASIVKGGSSLGVGILGDMAVKGISESVGSKITEGTVDRIRSLPPEKRQKAIEKLKSEYTKEKDWQSGWGGTYENIVTLGGTLGEGVSKSKSGGIERILRGLGETTNFAQGGVMVGESAGSQGEEVMSLTSAAGRKITGDKGSTSDPGMQSSAASTLSVVDQFIKGMGPLGAPVAQALGPDISNLTRTFGMSQTLPNLKIGGGKFKEDGNAKRTKDNFIEKLISGSLEALDAKKKKDENMPTPAATGPGSTGTPEQQAAADERAKQQIESISPGGMKMTTMTSDGQQVQVRESVDKIAGVKIGTTTPNLFGQEENVMGPGTAYRPVEGTNKERWYDSDGRLYSWKPGTRIRELTPQEMKTGWNDRTFLRKPDTGHVRAHQGALDILNITPATPAIGEYSYTKGAVLVPQQTDPKKGKWQPENKEQGRFGGRAPSLPPATDIKLQQGGKVKQRPWWDFLNMTQQKPKVSNLGKDYAYQEKLYAAKARASQIGTTRQGSAGGNSIGGGNAAAYVPPKPKKQPKSQPSRSPVAVTQESSSDLESAAVINIVSAGGGGAAPMGSDKQTQASSNYISNPWPNGLAGVICTSPWSVV